MALNLVYALKGNEIVFVDDVETGKKCGCVCPACSSPLVAKNHGTKREHHFAHPPKLSCEYGYETSLHLAAKDILSKAKRMIIPPVIVEFPGSYKDDIVLSPEMEISIDRVELEARFEYIVPDVVVYAGKQQLFIEIFVTHKIDDHKLAKLKKRGISTIEIDLSTTEQTISPKELSGVLLKSSEEKTWRYNAKAEKWRNRFYSVADKRPTIVRGSAIHVDDCPLAVRRWRGTPYANVMRDCVNCPYHISTEWEGESEIVLCSGRLRISKIEDFKTSLSERVQTSDAAVSLQKNQSFASGRCPNCGGVLVIRDELQFWKCSHFPHCRFIAYVNPATGELKMKS